MTTAHYPDEGNGGSRGKSTFPGFPFGKWWPEAKSVFENTVSPLCRNPQVVNFQRCERVFTRSVSSISFVSGVHCHVCASSGGCVCVCYCVELLLRNMWLLSRPVQLFATPWTVARQASLSLTISLSLPKFMSIELVMPSSHLIL